MVSELAECVRAFEALEADRAQVLTQLMEWPSGCITFRPAPTAWSAVEVLDHIVRAEVGTTADLSAGLQTPFILGGEQRPRVAELDRLLRSDQNFQVPAAATTIHPDAQTTWPEVTIRWEQARTELRQLMSGLTPAQACQGVFCHPFAGWMTFGEVLDHFSAHLSHHRFQLNRLRAAWAE